MLNTFIILIVGIVLLLMSDTNNYINNVVFKMTSAVCLITSLIKIVMESYVYIERLLR